MATIFGETKIFVKTTAVVCISRRALKQNSFSEIFTIFHFHVWKVFQK